MVNETLVVDDNQIDVMLNEKVITDAGFSKKTTSCYSGEEALELMDERVEKNEPFPNLILLDMMMPRMDGSAFLTEFAKFPENSKKNTRIVFVTSAQNAADIKLAKENPLVVDYLNKPLNVEKLKSLSYRLNL